ncbi:ThiF family adenylyltransferase [Saccharothrix australiensis]|uniref:Bacteriocin biosynthesis cyclodehydratase domain-containing protein n=1 Tax=Saccharothrix australiensis TaxID=2072 RepID=A0A495VTX0_9PSEU|nr:ThiF family adenylyltransferase [Saccharothrix australiensis]RKT52772.1 bacteriocin biosynthesis cyclodehydratase domain-containing protein [Saccharothrix australiensis]
MNLPHRPRVLPGLPVLRRRADAVQIGTDSRHSLLIEDVPSPMDRALLDLSGRHTVPELREQLADHGDQAAELVRLLHGLADAGLVEETVPPPHGRLTPETTTWALRTGRPAPHLADTRAARSVVVHGDGRLTVAVATHLAAAGVGHVRVVARGRVNPEDTGSGYLDADVGRNRAEAAAEALRRVSSTVRTATSVRAPDLVVLADALVPPPELLRTLLLEGTPHLAVRAGEGLGVVGPLVVPGRSSCLRCADLHRTDADRGWPVLAAQLVDQPQQADLATVTATAGLATGQALLALDHRAARTRPPTWDATLEVDAYSGLVEHRIAPVHPRCECRSLA